MEQLKEFVLVSVCLNLISSSQCLFLLTESVCISDFLIYFFLLFMSVIFTLLIRFVVIDEAHAYKGAFGCHTALILRRLRRLCSHGTFSLYGAQ